MNDNWLTECEACVRAAAPALHDNDVELIALDLRRLLPALTPGAAVDRYFAPGEIP